MKKQLNIVKRGTLDAIEEKAVAALGIVTTCLQKCNMNMVIIDTHILISLRQIVTLDTNIIVLTFIFIKI